MNATWTEEAIRALGTKTTVEIAGSIFGLSRTQAYEAVKAGRFPVPVLTLGPNRMIVPVAPILQALKISTEANEEKPSAVTPDELADLVAERVVNRLVQALSVTSRLDTPPAGTPAPRVLKPGAASGPEAA